MIGRYIPEPLQKIAQQVANGERPQCSVRTILSWYRYERRSRYIVSEINQDLIYLKLGTVPHFDWTYLDGVVTFMPRDEAIKEYPLAYQTEVPKTESASLTGTLARDKDTSHAVDVVVQNDGTPPQTLLDPTYRIGRLSIANRRPFSIAPDATVREAITIMLKHDYSQLPVMTGERSLKGLFSWKSYGSRRSLGQECAFVRDAMADCRKVSANDSIFYVVALIQDHDCVFVEDATGIITGIITPYDISVTSASSASRSSYSEKSRITFAY
jgi:CBS domain-containing protein